MSKTPKKDKKKKSKRKSDEIASSPIASTSNGDKGNRSSEKKDKKKKHQKKKDRKDNNEEPNTRDTIRLPNETIQQPIAADTNSNNNVHPAGSILSILSKTANNNQSNDEFKNSPYQIKTIIGTAALLPTSLNSVSGKIKSLLHSLLLRYDGNLGGVLLSLEDDATILPMESDGSGSVGGGSKALLVGGRIIDDLPYVHYRFQVHGLVFCPRVGMKLKGQVIDCTETFITLTTHHILSTKISTSKLHQQGFFFNEATMEWSRERDTDVNDDSLDNGPSTTIYLDDTVEFIVEKIHECGGNVMLDGTMPLVSSLC